MLTVLSNRDYKLADRILYENSDHPECIVTAVEQHVLPLLQQKRCFLDIGPGPGQITNALAAQFGHTTIIEPNPEFHQYYDERAMQIICSTFQDTQLTEAYDFVLCSHMLYHVELREWPSFLDKALACVASGGILMVNMIAQRGYHHKACLQFTDNYPSSRQVIEYLNEKKIRYKLIHAEYSYTTMVFEEMYTLCRFFLLEDLFSPKKWKALSNTQKERIEERIFAYAKARKTTHGNYILHHQGDYIIIPR